MLTEHDADAPVPVRVHEPLGVNVTVPVGVIAVPIVELSVTVAVQLVAWLMATVDGVHVTLVVVGRTVTVTVVLPVLLL